MFELGAECTSAASTPEPTAFLSGVDVLATGLTLRICHADGDFELD